MPVYLKFFDWQILRSGRIYKSSLFEDDHSYYLTPLKAAHGWQEMQAAAFAHPCGIASLGLLLARALLGSAFAR